MAALRVITDIVTLYWVTQLAYRARYCGGMFGTFQSMRMPSRTVHFINVLFAWFTARQCSPALFEL